MAAAYGVVFMQLAASAHAQELPSVTETSGLEIRPSVEVRYDDNLFRNNSATTDTISSTVAVPGVNILYGRDFGNLRPQLTASASYEFYSHDDSLNKPRFDIAGQVETEIVGRCHVRPYGRFRQQRADYGDINTTHPNLQRYTTLLVDAGCRRSVGFYPLASVMRKTTDNNYQFRNSDQESWSYAAGVGYARPSLGQGSLYYMHTVSDRKALNFKNKIDQFGVSFNRAVVSHISFQIDTHWLHVRSTNAEIPGFDGPGWNATIIVRPVPNLLVRGETRREIANDPLVQAGYSINTSYALLAQLSLASRLRLTARGEKENRKFRRDPLLVFSPIDSDRQYIYTAGLAYDLTHRMQVATNFTHARRRTNSGVNNYAANIGTVSLSTRF